MSVRRRRNPNITRRTASQAAEDICTHLRSFATQTIASSHTIATPTAPTHPPPLKPRTLILPSSSDRPQSEAWYAALTRSQRGTHVNKPDLASRVPTRTSMSKTGAEALVVGDTITIARFGTFSTRSRLPCQGRYPRRGESIAIATSNTPSFKTAKTPRHAVRFRPPRQNPAAVPLNRRTTELCWIYRKVCDLTMERHELFQYLPIGSFRTREKE